MQLAIVLTAFILCINIIHSKYLMVETKDDDGSVVETSEDMAGTSGDYFCGPKCKRNRRRNRRRKNRRKKKSTTVKPYVFTGSGGFLGRGALHAPSF